MSKKKKKEWEEAVQEEHRSDLGKAVWGALLLIGMGVLLMLRPDFGTHTVAVILGWVMIAAGAIGVLVCVLSWPVMGVIEIILSVAVTAFGVFILVKPGLLPSIIGIGFGIYLLLHGLSALLESLKLKKLGYDLRANLIMALVMVALGVLLLFFPMNVANWIIRVIGGAMALCGGASLFLRTSALRKLRQPKNVVDADK